MPDHCDSAVVRTHSQAVHAFASECVRLPVRSARTSYENYERAVDCWEMG